MHFMAEKRPDDKSPSELVGEIVRIYRRGNVWWANAQVGRRQHRESLRTTSLKEARVRALRWESELLSGRGRQVSRPATVEDVIAAYLEHLRTEGRAKKTLVKYNGALVRLTALMARRRAASLLDLDLAAMDAYRRERVTAGAAPKTVYHDTIVVRQMVNFALSRRMIDDDPLRGLTLRRPKPTPQPCWSTEEVDRILAASPEPYRLALTLLADTGMRVGELRHMTWPDIDFDRNLLHVRPKGDWKPKSGDQRAIPMSIRTRTLLERLDRQGPRVVSARVTRDHPAVGRQLSERRLLQALKRIVAELGLPGHLHTFRHAFISRSLMSGIAEAIVREWLGHVDRDVLKLYTHIASAASQAAMRRLATGPEGSPDGSDPTPGSGSVQIQHNEESSRNDQRAI
jgi:site-specific recombinase XerD